MSGYKYNEFDFGGFKRKYMIHLPTNLPKGAPLLFVLHGYTGSPESIRIRSNMDELANINGFAVVYPHSTYYKGNTYWNAGLNLTEVNDIDFLETLAKKIQKEYDLSDKNIFCTGFSNGGFMSYALACSGTQVFSCIASVSGLISKGTWGIKKDIPCSVLHIHGGLDKAIPHNGTKSIEGVFIGAPGMDEILEYWKKINNVDKEEIILNNENTIAKRFINSKSNLEVSSYFVSNYGHSWPGDLVRKKQVEFETAGFDASEVIWDFFARHIK